MKFGLALNAQAELDQHHSTLADSLVRQTELARDAGFDLIKIGQHYLSDYTQLQPIPMLARLSSEAGDMVVATGVVILPLHHPIEIAEQIATLDALSENVVLGVGAGYRDVEFESFGVPKSERGTRLHEGVELVNRLLTERNVTYHGDHYQVDGVTINPRPTDKPEVWIAANTRPAIERAARISDRWFASMHPSIHDVSEQKEAYDAIREEQGASTAIPLLREAFVGRSSDEAKRIAREYLEPKYERYLSWGDGSALADQFGGVSTFDELVEDRFLVGTPEEVCEEIERYAETVDISHLVLRMHWPGMDYSRSYDCIELIGDEVIPNVDV